MWQTGGRGVWGRMDTCMCVSETLHCSPETHNIVLYPNTKEKVNKIKNLMSFYPIIFLWVLSRILLFVTPWTVAHQPPLSMGFSRQVY